MPTLAKEGTPVAEIQVGDRFDHWLHGPVTVLRKYDVTDNHGRPLVRLGLMGAAGEFTDDWAEWRPGFEIHLLLEG